LWFPTSGAMKLRQIWGTQSYMDSQTWTTRARLLYPHSAEFEIGSHNRRICSIKPLQLRPTPRAKLDVQFRYERQGRTGYWRVRSRLHSSILKDKGHSVLIELNREDTESASSGHLEIGPKSVAAKRHSLSKCISEVDLYEELRDEPSGLRAGGLHVNLLPRWGVPGLDSQTWNLSSHRAARRSGMTQSQRFLPFLSRSAGSWTIAIVPASRPGRA